MGEQKFGERLPVQKLGERIEPAPPRTYPQRRYTDQAPASVVAARIAPGMYHAKGDPNLYQVDEDMSVSVLGPSRAINVDRSATGRNAVAYEAILDQIRNGILTPKEMTHSEAFSDSYDRLTKEP